MSKPVEARLYFCCCLCDVSWNSLTKMKEHISKKHKIKEVKMEHYSPSFKVVSSEKDISNNTDGCYSCVLCNRTTSSKSDIVRHVKTVHQANRNVNTLASTIHGSSASIKINESPSLPKPLKFVPPLKCQNSVVLESSLTPVDKDTNCKGDSANVFVGTANVSFGEKSKVMPSASNKASNCNDRKKSNSDLPNREAVGLVKKLMTINKKSGPNKGGEEKSPELFKVTKVNYFKGLKNILIDNSMNVEFNLWKSSNCCDSDKSSMAVTNESSGRPSFNNTVTSTHESSVNEVLNSEIQHFRKTDSSECINLGPVCSGGTDLNTLDLSVNNVSSEPIIRNDESVRKKKKNSRGRPRHFVRRNRFHCGMYECVPCSIVVNCGSCTPCLNKVLK